MTLTSKFFINKNIFFVLSFWAFFILLYFPIQADSFFNPGLEKIQKGIQHFQNKDFESALNEFQKAEDIFPNESRLDYNIGSVLAKSGRYSESIPYFQKSLNGNDAKLRSKSYFNMGNAFVAENQKKKAMDSYRKALEEDPSNEFARRNMELLGKPNNKQNQSDSQSANSNQNPNGEKDSPQSRKDSKEHPNQSQEKNQSSNKNKSNQNSNPESNPNSKNSLSQQEADRIMDSLSSDKIQRNKSKEIFQFQREKFW